MTNSSKRSDELARAYVDMHDFAHKEAHRLTFKDGWDARDHDLRKQLGLSDDCEIEDVVKGMKKALMMYADPESWIKRDKSCWHRCVPDYELILNYQHPNTDWVGTIEVGGKRAREALKPFGEKE